MTLTDHLIREIEALKRRLEILESAEVYPNPAIGKLYTQDGSTAQTGITTTPTKLTGWASEGQELNLTISAANDQITVATPGWYIGMVQTSFSGTVSVTFELHARIDGVEVEEGYHRKLSTGGDVGSASFFAVLPCPNGNEVISTYIESDSGGGASFTLVDGQFIVWKFIDL